MSLRTFWTRFLQLYKWIKQNMTADPTKAAFDSRHETDRAFYVVEGQTGPIAPGDAVDVTVDTNPIAFRDGPDLVLFQGIWSLDGNTWYDCGAAKLLTSTFVNEWTTRIWAQSNEFWMSFWNANGASTQTVQYKAVLIATKNAEIRQLNTAENPKTADSRNTFQKIYYDEIIEYSVANGSTFTHTVTHNFGYIPAVRGYAYFDVINGVNNIDRFHDMAHNFGVNSVTPGMKITDTTAQFFITNSSGGTATGEIHARVYYDF